MPTGYTAALYEGEDVPFRDFVLRCARAMTPAILLRDYAMDVVPTPENINGGRSDGESYARRRLEQANDELNRWLTMTPEEVAEETNRHNTEQREAYQAALAESARREAAYTGMLQQVTAWIPPTPEHEHLKGFMIEQLKSSIMHDCGVSVAWFATHTPDELKEIKIERLGLEVMRLEQDVQKEAEMDAWRTAWVTALYESLPLEAVTA
jgi:hypothetical protein